MPESPFPMTLPGGAMLMGEPCAGGLGAQRAALAGMTGREGWPEITRNAHGKPLFSAGATEHGHCSLSHGGGWVIAARAPVAIGVDVEAPAERLEKVRRRFVGPLDQAVIGHFGDSLDTLCRLWTAKEAAFKVFGTGVDFLTGLQWTQVGDHGATVQATVQGALLDIRWCRLATPDAWMAVALVRESL